jgi:hypothetical protein
MRRLVLAMGLFAALTVPGVARAQPLPNPAWCPLPSVAPLGGWFWFVACGWVPSRHPWVYSVDTQLPASAAIGNVWFSVGNYNPYVPAIHVPMPALWPVGQDIHYAGCSQSLAAFLDWFSFGQFTAQVGVPGALPSPTPAYQVKVGMTGYCPN